MSPGHTAFDSLVGNFAVTGGQGSIIWSRHDVAEG